MVPDMPMVWVLIMLGLIHLNSIAKADSTLLITKAASRKTITVHKYDVIQIELEALGAAGYAWHIESLDPELLEIIRKDAIAHPRREKGVGIPVTHMWQLRAIKAGLTEIVMHYYRVWERKDTAIDEFRLRVKILCR